MDPDPLYASVDTSSDTQATSMKLETAEGEGEINGAVLIANQAYKMTQPIPVGNNQCYVSASSAAYASVEERSRGHTSSDIRQQATEEYDYVIP